MPAIIKEGLWVPPDGMEKSVRLAWLGFYNRAMGLYGVTPSQYRDLYLVQKGRCWICQKAKGVHPDDPKGRGGRRLGIDHNHVTLAVRGLLCTGGDKTCNRIIGWLGPAALRRAAEYLEGRQPMVALNLLGDVESATAELWP